MRTPFGKECKFYYADYFRGRNTQECRLIQHNPESERWFVALCQTCPVPDILLANQCPNLRIRGRVASGFLGLTKKVEVEAYCAEYGTEVTNPKVGCGHCHEFKAEREDSGLLK
jgi:hypothetical protein